MPPLLLPLTVVIDDVGVVIDDVNDVVDAVTDDVDVVDPGNRRTLESTVSATHRLPIESNATSPGEHSPVRVAIQALEVKLDCPMTRYASMPLENGRVYMRTLESQVSATHRLSVDSKALPRG